MRVFADILICTDFEFGVTATDINASRCYVRLLFGRV